MQRCRRRLRRGFATLRRPRGATVARGPVPAASAERASPNERGSTCGKGRRRSRWRAPDQAAGRRWRAA
eukprot:3295926-Lingulodinium_polyedra.AAC.1